MKKIIKFNNPEYLLLFFLAFLYYVFVLSENHSSLDFNYQYFLYDYHFGFIKRALIGSILNFIFPNLSESIFINLSIVILFIFGFYIVKLIDNINFKNAFFGYFLVALLVISPALLKNFWFDLGRLDIFGAFFCLFFLLPVRKSILNIFLLLSPLVLFIHEGFFLLWIPSYYICWLIRNNIIINKFIIVYSCFFILLTFLTLFGISYFGKLNVTFDVFQSYINSKTETVLFLDSTVLTDKLYDQIISSLISNFTHIKFWFLGLANLFSIVYIGKIFLKIVSASFRKYKIIFLPLILTFFMFFLGCDALRWFSNMCFSFYILLICIMISNKNNLHEDNVSKNDLYFLIFILLVLLPFKNLGLLWY